MNRIVTFRDLLEQQVNDLYNAERTTEEALDNLARKAHSDDLHRIINKQQRATREHLHRLEKVFRNWGIRTSGERPATIEGLVRDTMRLADKISDPELRDASIIRSLQCLNHYKVASYGTLAAYCSTLGEMEARNLFHESSVAEKEIDRELSDLAIRKVNDKAKKAGMVAVW